MTSTTSATSATDTTDTTETAGAAETTKATGAEQLAGNYSASDRAAIAGSANTTDAQDEPGAFVPQATGGRENAFAITSFVLGIASVVSSWTFIAPIIGLVFGVLALRRNTSERTLALWGVWLNIAMLALTVLIVLGFLLLMGLGFVASLASV